MMKDTVRKITAVIVIAAIYMTFFVFTGTASDVFLSGDLDMDGKISSSDARLALRYSVDLDYYTKGDQILGDMNADGIINASDARTILRISVGLEEPVCGNIEIDSLDFEEYVNLPEMDELFAWEIPPVPEVDAEPGTFTFTVYGYGHGVGLSQYGAMTLEDAGYSYDRILSHYYTGTEVAVMSEIPQYTDYPTLTYSEELGYETYVKVQQPTQELLARIVYQEIYGVTENGKYEESLKALTLCVFSNLAYYKFNISSRWDVGIASPLSYEELPLNLRELVSDIFGEYITVKGEEKPIIAVFSGLAAGMTASSESIWGGALSYLTAVPSPFDMKRDDFISECTYTVEEMRNKIMSYDSSIVLSDDPSEWLQILEHTGSIDEKRGYVTRIRVGNKELKGYNQFLMGLMGNALRSPCYMITYTP